MDKTKNIVYNTSFGLNCLLLFLVLFGKSLTIPTWLQVVGRMHPLLLHFPIVLLVIAAIWESFLLKNVINAQNTEGVFDVGFGIWDVGNSPKSEISNPKSEVEPLPTSETRNPKSDMQLGDWILLSTALMAAGSALMGLFLSQEEGYNADAIAWHKWTGVAVSFMSFGWYVFRHTVRETKHLSLATSIISLVVVTFAGHQGANITHGEGFLTAPFKAKNEQMVVSVNDAVIFTDLIKPILDNKCMSCHNATKAKGDLVMETQEQILRGGKNGKLWDLTIPDLGLMMHRIHLPMNDEKHMSPTGKPQLTDEEKAILFHWIKIGADFTKKVSELPETDTIRILANTLLKKSEVEVYDFKAADESTIKKLNNNYRIVSSLAENSPALGVEFFGASQFKNAQLTELSAIKTQIVHLTLNKMPVTDEDVKTIAGFTNLRKLNLSFTQITGATLGELKNLKELQQLSLSGTPVKKAHVEFLKDLPHLASLHIWNTAISSNDVAELKAKLPKTSIETGFRGDTVIARLSAPILENEEIQVFKEDTKIELKHYVKGAVIRYTLDGSNPDSLKSPVYTDLSRDSREGGIMIDKTGILKAKAYLPDWISSEIFSKQFYKAGFTADSVRLASAPNPQYTGKSTMLIDGKLGDTNFKSGKWFGFKETPFEAYLYFNTPVMVSKITINSLIDIGSYIMPAQHIEVWGGKDAANLTLLKSLDPTQPTKIESLQFKGFEFSFGPQKISVIKLVAKSVQKLPLWHPGKGDKGWFFVDEVFLN
jgi:uncharacterized membrane protein